MGFFCGLPVCVPVRQRKKTLPTGGPVRQSEHFRAHLDGALGVQLSINLTSRAGELRSAPSEPDDRCRVTG